MRLLCRTVGGDWNDYILLQNNRSAIVLTGIAGKEIITVYSAVSRLRYTNLHCHKLRLKKFYKPRHFDTFSARYEYLSRLSSLRKVSRGCDAFLLRCRNTMTEEVEQQIVELLRAESLTNERIDRLNDAVWRLSFVKPLRAKFLGAQALGLSIKNDYRRGSGYALTNIGWCELHLDDCRQAEATLDWSRKIFADSRDSRGTATVLNALATARRKIGDFQAASDYYSSALELYEESNDKAGSAGALLNVGIVHNQTGDYALALDYYYQSLALAAEADASVIKARTHTCLGDVLWRVKETDLAIENSRRAIEIFQEHPDRRNVCVALVNLGAAYQQRGNCAEAAGFYERGLEKAREIGNVETQAEAHKCLGGVRLEFNESAEAIAHFEQALKLSFSREA